MQSPGPTGDHDSSDDTHGRVKPRPTEEQSGEQRQDRQHRGQGVGQDVHIGSTQSVVLMGRMAMPDMVIIVVMMLVPVTMSGPVMMTA